MIGKSVSTNKLKGAFTQRAVSGNAPLTARSAAPRFV
jgi:hypothetical protein